MDDITLLSKRINVRHEERAVVVQGTDEQVSLSRGEFIIMPDLALGKKFKEIKELKSYVIFDNVIVVNSVISFKANLIVEVLFLDNGHGFDINRFKIPFEDKIECDKRNLKRIDLKGELKGYNLIIAENSLERLKNIEGAVIAEGSFDVNIVVEMQ